MKNTKEIIVEQPIITGNIPVNQNLLPQFKIHGLERRQLKKELSGLKSFLKSFWYYHQLEKDMAGFYNSPYTMTDEQAKECYERELLKVEKIENQLAEKYEG